MILYSLGTRPCPVIITIETIPGAHPFTDPDNPHSHINLTCGKVLKISDASGKIVYDWANVKIGDEKIKVKREQYFLTGNSGLPCYSSRLPVLEELDPERLFTGVRYKHYINGKIRDKLCYGNGNLLSSFSYRDDVYNTICKSVIYRHGKPELVNTYDEREVLVKHQWLTEKGKQIAELTPAGADAKN